MWEGYGASALPERRCPNCGKSSRTQLAKCPHCDRRFDRKLPWLTDPMRWVAGAVGLVAFGVACALILPGVFDARDEGNAQRAAESAALRAAKRAELEREQRPKTGRGPAESSGAAPADRLAARAALVSSVESAILQDARTRLASGELDGAAIDRVHCDPLVRDSNRAPDHEVLDRPIGRYDCVAVQREVLQEGKVVGLFGHPFVAALDFASGRYTFCKDNKAPSERGKVLAQVRLKPACFGLPADAEPLGNGYVLPDS